MYPNRAWAATTVNVEVPVNPVPASVAVITEVPVASACATPVVAPIVAVAAVPDVQVTAPVRGCVSPLLRSSRAVNGTVVPTAAFGFAGATFKPTATAVPTVRVVCPITPLRVAEIADVPLATAVAKPDALIVAVAAVAEAQVTCPVMSCVLVIFVIVFRYVPVAVNCSVPPAASVGRAGVTAID